MRHIPFATLGFASLRASAARGGTSSLAIALVAFGCSEQEFHKIPDHTRNGELTLAGRVCDPVRNSWLEGAIVYTHLFDSQDRLFGTSESITDADGNFLLDRLASGVTYTVHVQHGNELIDVFDVEMPDTDVVLPDPDCSAIATSNVAVVTGDYDEYGEVLPQVGIASWDSVNGLTGEDLVQFLSNEDVLVQYDAIFFPGGHLEEDVIYDTDGSDTLNKHIEVQDALRAYVQQGGTIIASDWSYDVIERVWPNQIDFLGDDLTPDAAQAGEEASVLATVVDSSLESSVGASSVGITFDLIEWPVMEGAGSGTTVHLSANVPYREGFETYNLSGVPILVSFQDGDGTVVFSSFRYASNNADEALEVIRYFTNAI